MGYFNINLLRWTIRNSEKGEFVGSTFMADMQSIVDAYGKKKNE